MLTNRRYKGYKQRHAARLLPYFRRIRLKIISLNEIYVLVADATDLKALNLNIRSKEPQDKPSKEYYSMYEIGRRGDRLTFL